MGNNDNFEIEVKFFVGAHEPIREVLKREGAALEKERVHERNVVFDTADFQLKKAQKLLRLRQDERVRLTVKAPAPKEVQAQSEAKVREELEVELSDFATAEKMLTRLGFDPKLVYEKYRETWQIGAVEVVLDEMPYGNFIEFEGPEADLKPLAAQMGINWSKRILTNYLALFVQAKEAAELNFNDLTFENFEAAEFDGADLWA